MYKQGFAYGGLIYTELCVLDKSFKVLLSEFLC